MDEGELCGTCEEEERVKRETCKHCKKVSNSQDGLECDNCASWFHRQCENIEDLWKELQAKKGMLYLCKVCAPKIKRNLQEMNKIRMESQETKKENEIMMDKLQELKSENQEGCKRMKDILHSYVSIN